jgi:hypothetical protein
VRASGGGGGGAVGNGEGNDGASQKLALRGFEFGPQGFAGCGKFLNLRRLVRDYVTELLRLARGGVRLGEVENMDEGFHAPTIARNGKIITVLFQQTKPLFQTKNKSALAVVSDAKHHSEFVA